MSQLSSFVWGIADVLRGPYKPKAYGNVILPFTVLRRLECVMEKHRDIMVDVLGRTENDIQRRALLRQLTRTDANPGLTFWNASPYTLAKALQDPDNLAANLIDYINGFSTDVDMFKHFGEGGFEPTIRNLDEIGALAIVTRRFAEVDLSPDTVDNAGMGDLFEHLIYKFAEASNEEAGDFYTPRDAVRTLVDLVFAEDTDGLSGAAVRSVYDPAAGTGGMLSVAEEHVQAMNSDARLALFAQELNGDSYAICKSDMLIKGQDVTNIKKGDTLSDDQHADEKFDYILSNPPYGQDWKREEESVRKENAGQKFDPLVASQKLTGRFGAGLPDVGDGAMLFLQHAVSKMRPADEFGRGGRVGMVLSGSPLFNGGAGSGPSSIRGWLLENDLLESIVALPNDMFYNTGITTYLWILDNTKAEERQGKVRLVDATGLGSKLRKSLGAKRVEISKESRELIVKAAAGLDDTVPAKDFDNLDFAYWEVTVCRPLKLNFACTSERIAKVAESKTLSRIEGLEDALATFDDGVYPNRDSFLDALTPHLSVSGVKTTPAQHRSIAKAVGEADDTADVCLDTNGNPEPGGKDSEIVPFGWGGHAKSHDARDETVAAYFEAEVTPHVPDAWMDEAKTKMGYEIPFTRHFYTYVPPRSLAEIDAELDELVGEIVTLLKEVEA